MKKSKSTIFGRSFSLAKMALDVGVKELRSGDIQSRIEQAKTIAKTLSDLKGAAMKVGQLLSIDLADYFPEEAAAILSQLQNNATQEKFEVIQTTLVEELGKEKLGQYTSIEEVALASASISQIHRAKLNGLDVVLKVQHRFVADSIENDIKMLNHLITLLSKFYRKSINFDFMFAEIQTVLTNELDFHYEQKSLLEFQDKLQRFEYRNKIILPTVYADYSTKKVLTMSYESGITLNQWILNRPNQSEKEKIARLMLELYCFEFFTVGMVQTDPNFSNFLIREVEGDLQLVLLDFGATKKYDQQFIDNYVTLIKSLENDSADKIIELSIEFGFLNREESPEVQKLYLEMMSIAIEPFMKCKKVGSFSFSDIEYSKRSNAILREFITSLKYSAPPHQIIFLHRKLGGLFALLKRLNLELDIYPYWTKMTKQDR